MCGGQTENVTVFVECVVDRLKMLPYLWNAWWTDGKCYHICGMRGGQTENATIFVECVVDRLKMLPYLWNVWWTD